MPSNFINYRIIDEILEFMWIEIVDKNKKKVPVSILLTEIMKYFKNPEEVLEKLQKMEYIRIEKNDVVFAEKGKERAIHVIRSHRLAERLLKDVVDFQDDAILEQQACNFEHTIDDSVEAAICTLLGHPKICPHGFAIPPGPCCKAAATEIEPIIKSLNELDVGEEGRCLYFTSDKNKEMHRLMSIGIIPGVQLRVHQKMPFNGPIVIQIDQTQYALDPSIAKNIYVRVNSTGKKIKLKNKKFIPKGPKGPKRKRKFKGRRKKHFYNIE